MQEKFQAVHRQAQIRELGLRRFVSVAGLQALGGAMEALTQGTVFVGVAQLPQQSPDLVRPPPGVLDQCPGAGKRGASRLCVLEQPALERAALPRTFRIKPATPILAQGRTRLGKASDGRLAAGNGNREPERFELPGIIAPLEFDKVEEGAVAA